MAIKHVADFLEVVKEDKSLQRLIQLATDVDSIAKIAQERDFKFTSKELQSHLGKTTEPDFGVEINPGIGNRLHLNPR
jgi:predicted ribosomally synthesized peptide with nif11-like leader